MYKKIVSNLVSTNCYFNQQTDVRCSRALGINEYGFRCDENSIEHRENVWYFSNEFETILLNYSKNSKQTDETRSTDKKTTTKIDTIMDIEKIFYQNIDKLKDLSWIIVDYY
jgi:hypothetical protein